MSKTIKRILAAVLAVALLIGGAWGVMILIRNLRRKPVPVYAVSGFSTSDMYGTQSESTGMVTSQDLQKIWQSESQTVREIFVRPGQTVRKGDPLVSYDTTLTEIDLERARLAVSKAELKLENDEKELKRLRAMRPYSSVLVIPENTVEYKTVTPPLYLSGSGKSEEDPAYILIGDKLRFTPETILGWIPEEELPAETEGTPENGEGEETPAGEAPEETPEKPDDGVRYAVLLIREYDALNGRVLSSYGVEIAPDGGMSFFTPFLPPEIEAYDAPPEPYYKESGSPYTAAELRQMRDEKQQEIEEETLALKISRIDLERKEKEVADGVVRSEIDGLVTAVRTESEAAESGEALLEVSAGGGYYIRCTMNEMERDALFVGSTVNVTSWMNGVSCSGEVVEIGDYPTNNEYSYSSGNQNVSYYPFTVFVSGDEALREYDYVSVTYQSRAGTTGTFFLQNEFIRTDGSRSYCFVRGADGLLEERTIRTGRDLWGSYTEIRGGLTMEDFVAFPYGKNVVSGAKTEEAEAQSFYERW
ncbi:MAG: hypothetical protein J5849_07190 [Clostridia bacterium]|nr:hypothetical protein [Clostridia bacterium]MBR5742648.1 hypothetical protein [Clostridia bacterium]